MTFGRSAVLAMLVWILAASSSEASEAVPTKRDNTLVTAVLRDLAKYEGEDSPIKGFGPSALLPFANVPSRYRLSPEDLLYRLDEEKWKALTKSQLRAVGEAARHAARRPKRKGLFEIADPLVQVRSVPDKRPEVERFLDRPITMHLPGFSTDGQVAIVRFYVPWSIHSVTATYILRLEQGTWAVLLRQFGYVL